jgi:glyoxylase-like metal-dependent hydrolase (beta-lactamase superfamily II)
MNITALDVDFMGIKQTIACFLIEGPKGFALVEAGPYSTFSHLTSALAAHNVPLSEIKEVFLSHIHFDHAGAAWAFAEQGATIYVHPKGLPHLAEPEKLYNSARMIYQDQMDILWGAMNPIPMEKLYAPEHGETIHAAGLEFRAWYTPGHAVHHIAWQVNNPATGATSLFTGDVAGVKIGDGPVMPPCPPPDIQIEDWLASIQLMQDLAVEDLYLTHFGLITNKTTHLESLKLRLLAWSQWMKPFAEQQTPAENIIPQFKAYVQNELHAAGLNQAGIQQYEAANPAFMSVAGLLRYWKKKLESDQNKTHDRR